MNSTNSASELIAIKIIASDARRFKSIHNLKWEGIPKFAILTGRNGAGKTQLLELLAHKLTETQHPQLADLSFLKVDVQGDRFDAGEIAYVRSVS
jgi:recombinational DNA repair ATPase RecF